MNRGPPSLVGHRAKSATFAGREPGGGRSSTDISSDESSIQLSRRIVIVYRGLAVSNTSTLNPLRVDLQITFAGDKSRTVSKWVTTVSSEVRVSASVAFASFK